MLSNVGVVFGILVSGGAGGGGFVGLWDSVRAHIIRCNVCSLVCVVLGHAGVLWGCGLLFVFEHFQWSIHIAHFVV